ncbi:MAG: histone deacetylase [Gemmatimonadetes bacterium]|nr:histone deacetylase [Gemmatimonadota bacterium]
MKVFACDSFVLPLPEGHRFPMEKYALLREAVEDHPAVEIRLPEAATDEDLLRVHEAAWVARVAGGALEPADVRRIGFPWSLHLVERSRRSVGATLAAGRAALAEGWAANLAGGTHHAFPGHGEGFCVFNDVAVAARAVQAEGMARRIAVLDLDVHQGNGTAAVFRGDDDVFTLSVHGEGNYPFRKEPGDLDLGLPDGTGDDAYLAAVEAGVEAALAGGADLAFYVAGADPWVGDRLGRLAVSADGLAARDRLVLDRCGAAGVPVAVVMAGGYAHRVQDTVAIHAATVLEAAERWTRRHGGRRVGGAARLSAAGTGA